MSTAGRHDFAIVDSTTIYTGAILALRVDRVAMPGGRIASREVVEHHGAVAIAAVDELDRVVLIHQYRHPLGRRLWELPAGLMDSPDEDPVEAARRELIEEVGLDADSWSMIADVAASPGFTDEVLRIFLATDLRDAIRPEAHGEEADLQMERVALADAVAMVLGGEIVNASACVGILALAAIRAGAPGAELRPTNTPWQDLPTAFAARVQSDTGSARS